MTKKRALVAGPLKKGFFAASLSIYFACMNNKAFHMFNRMDNLCVVYNLKVNRLDVVIFKNVHRSIECFIMSKYHNSRIFVYNGTSWINTVTRRVRTHIDCLGQVGMYVLRMPVPNLVNVVECVERNFSNLSRSAYFTFFSLLDLKRCKAKTFQVSILFMNQCLCLKSTCCFIFLVVLSSCSSKDIGSWKNYLNKIGFNFDGLTWITSDFLSLPLTTIKLTLAFREPFEWEPWKSLFP